MTDPPTATTLAALEAAGIPPERWGRARTARLSDSERALYTWILHALADGHLPQPAALAAEASRRGIPLGTTLAALAREDLVHLGRDGMISVAYPFSGPRTPHRVQLNGHTRC